MKRLYKNKYCICLYERKTGTLLQLFDSVKDLASFIGKPIKDTTARVSMLFASHKETNLFKVDNNYVELAFVDMSDDD